MTKVRKNFYIKYPVRRILLAFFSVLFVFVGFAQRNGGQIKGYVIDENDREPLVGATISVVNGAHGALSGENGLFVIPVRAFPVTISVSYLGYKPVETIVNDSNTFCIIHENL